MYANRSTYKYLLPIIQKFHDFDMEELWRVHCMSLSLVASSEDGQEAQGLDGPFGQSALIKICGVPLSK